MPHATPEARREYAQRYVLIPENRQRKRENHKRWRLANPEKVQASSQQNYSRRKDKHRALRFRNMIAAGYDLSVTQWIELFLAQNKQCAICGATDDKFHVDHDHKSGKVRAILCRFCNTALGFFDDSPARFRKAADYLEHHAA